jgi:hypothetical protein
MISKLPLLVRPITLATLFALTLAFLFNQLTPTQAAPPFPDQRQAATTAVKWLIETHQNDDGGYTSFSGGANLAPSGVSGTADAILALSSAGDNPAATYPGKTSNPIHWLATHPLSISVYAATNGGAAGKVVLALSAANQNPRDFVGYNWVISLTTLYSNTGKYANDPINQSLAIMALKAVSSPIPVMATQWLTRQQTITTGGWPSFGFDDIDATALSLMALVAAGVPTDDLTIIKGVEFLRQNQDATSGGWAPFGTVSANSTALTIQAIAAVGQDFYSPSGAWAKNGKTPLSALLELQHGNGAFQVDYSDGQGLRADFYSTVQAIPGVIGKPYPWPSRYQAAKRGLNCLAQQQAANGGFPAFGSLTDSNKPGANGTARAIQAIIDFGENPTSSQWTKTGGNPMQALETLAPAFLDKGQGGQFGIIMQAVAKAARLGAPYTVTNFAGRNLVTEIVQKLDKTTGEYDSTAFGTFKQAEAMLGLLESGQPVDSAAVAWLLNWLDDPANIATTENNPDDVGILLKVLGQVGIQAETALSQAHALQKTDGTWATFAAANSSSEIGQGLVASGLNPFDPTWSRVVTGQVINVADALMNQQQANGCWNNTDAFATTDAISLLSLQPSWASGSLIVTATVGAGLSCGTTNEWAALPGSQVTYCYTLQNNSPFTLTRHSLVDSEWGAWVAPDFALELAPQAQTTLSKTVTITPTTNRHILYWRAHNPAIPNLMLFDGAMASVHYETNYLPILLRK